MMNMTMKMAIAIAVTGFLVVGCNKDKGDFEPPLNDIYVTNLPADTTTGFSPTGRPIGSNLFTHISLRDNKIIEGADTLTNKWDIAFKQFYIKVNGGTSATGGGNAAAFIATSTFEEYKMVNEAEASFRQDNGAEWAINPMPGTWYTYNPATFIALPTPGRVIVIRTADGRYAKLEILSFYRNGQTPDVSATPVQKALNQFFYQIRYTFQPNGSKSF